MSAQKKKLISVEIELQKATRRVLILVVLLLVYVFYVVVMHPVSLSLRGIRELDNILLFIISLIASLIIIRKLTYVPEKPFIQDDDLTTYARSLANQLGVKFHNVKILEGDYGTRHPGAWLKRRDGAVLITRKLIEVLTREEVEWVIAHELAHLKQEIFPSLNALSKLSALVALPPFLFLVSLFTIIKVNGSLVSLIIVYGVPILVVFSLFFFSFSIQRCKEYEADLIALKSTGNLAAAISALMKFKDSSQDPSSCEKEIMEDHPSVSNRIKMLRKAVDEKR